jgi:hypothetical protein
MVSSVAQSNHYDCSCYLSSKPCFTSFGRLLVGILTENDNLRLSYVVTKSAEVAVTPIDLLRRGPFQICTGIPASVTTIALVFPSLSIQIPTYYIE